MLKSYYEVRHNPDIQVSELSYLICSDFSIFFHKKITFFSVTFGTRQSCWHIFGGRSLFLVRVDRGMLVIIVDRIVDFCKYCVVL
jgi:hypothetical protein